MLISEKRRVSTFVICSPSELNDLNHLKIHEFNLFLFIENFDSVLKKQHRRVIIDKNFPAKVQSTSNFCRLLEKTVHKVVSTVS